jgi:hypothetical protein
VFILRDSAQLSRLSGALDSAGRRLESDRDLAIARTVDKVRKKFGSKGIVPGALVEGR